MSSVAPLAAVPVSAPLEVPSLEVWPVPLAEAVAVPPVPEVVVPPPEALLLLLLSESEVSCSMIAVEQPRVAARAAIKVMRA